MATDQSDDKLQKLHNTIQYAEFELLVALLSFSMLATYASESSESPYKSHSVAPSLHQIATLIKHGSS